MSTEQQDIGKYIQQLRLAMGFDIAELAHQATLSIEQLRQIELGLEESFYSPEIRAQAVRRLLRILNQAPETTSLVDSEKKVPEKNVIDDIVRLSENKVRFPDVGVVYTDTVLLMRWGALFILIATIIIFLGPDDVYQTVTGWFTSSTPTTTEPAVPANATSKVEPSTPQVVVEEVIVPIAKPAKTEVLAAAITSTPATPSVAVATPTTTSTSCDNLKMNAISAEPISVHKLGNYVYFLANKELSVCVEDGDQKITKLELKPNIGRSTYGKGPWVVASQDLEHIQIYFQGSRVLLPASAPKKVILTEKPVPN
ncbi:MAG: XRE family transcriptional regulator [Limnohabitans sp.]|nr:XRE family transcriptional regulator [Limnohabitans sp.]